LIHRPHTRDAPDLGQIKGLKWTHFFVACLLNPDQVKERGGMKLADLIEDLHVLNAHAMPVNHINDSETRQTTAGRS
jgi:DNA ligase-4